LKKVLITGANGQLAQELNAIVTLFPQISFQFTDRSQLDISNEALVATFIAQSDADFVINTAAYTAVDKAESERDVAFAINEKAVASLAKDCAATSKTLIHISTDFVFDGSKNTPYKSSDPCMPLGVYGESKRKGEEQIESILSQHIIIRTSWLYSNSGNNFYKTMSRLGKERPTLNVVYDQVGTPTYARDLAHAICHIVLAEKQHYGTYHFSNEGVCSWYDFAHSIMQLQDLPCKVHPIESFEYPTPAKRPAYSVLDKRSLRDDYQIAIDHWQDALIRCINDAKA